MTAPAAAKKPESTPAEFAREVHEIEADLRKIEAKWQAAKDATAALKADYEAKLEELRGFIHEATPSLFQR